MENKCLVGYWAQKWRQHFLAPNRRYASHHLCPPAVLILGNPILSLFTSVHAFPRQT